MRAIRDTPLSEEKFHKLFTQADKDGVKRIKIDMVDQSYKYWMLYFLRDIAESLRRLPVDMNIED